MGFAAIDNSKSVRSTNSIFAHKKGIEATIEKMQKNEISKFWSEWVLPNDGRPVVVFFFFCIQRKSMVSKKRGRTGEVMAIKLFCRAFDSRSTGLALCSCSKLLFQRCVQLCIALCHCFQMSHVGEQLEFSFLPNSKPLKVAFLVTAYSPSYKELKLAVFKTERYHAHVGCSKLLQAYYKLTIDELGSDSLLVTCKDPRLWSTVG